MITFRVVKDDTVPIGENMPTNTAAWLDAPYSDLAVREAPYTLPGPGEILIRNHAIAVNPLDAMKQSMGDLMYRWLRSPSVLGEDVAGEVAEVGAGVIRFGVGDRVVAYAVGMEKGRDHRAEGGFQSYTVVSAKLASPIPRAMTFEEAVVLPLGISTAAAGLFQKDQLGLRHPTSTGGPTGQTVVVWGGSTSVGSNAIQLARAAGYDVVSTASPRNHDRARRLGATEVFDYASPTVVEDIAAFLAGRPVAGVLAVGIGSAEPSVAVAIATGAKRVAMTSPSVSFETVPRRRGMKVELVSVVARLVGANVALQVRCRVRGIRAGFVWGSSIMTDEVGAMLWEGYLPAALADGSHVSSPVAEVVGTGLEHVQTALDSLRRGVSARKLVVRI